MKKITSAKLFELIALLPKAAESSKVIFRHINTGFSFKVAACVDTADGLEMHVGETTEKTGAVTIAGLRKLLERLQNSATEIKVTWGNAGAKYVDGIFDVVYVTDDVEFHESVMFKEKPRELDIVFPEDAPVDLAGLIDEVFEADGQVFVISF